MPTRSIFARSLSVGAAVTALGVALAGCASADAGADADADASTPEESLAVVSELHDLLPESIRESGVATVGAPYALKPSIFTDDAGAPQGISVDLSEALGEVLGIEFEWEETADPVTALQSGALDVSMGFLSDSPAREEVLTMVPQFLNTSTLLTEADADIADLASLCGQALAVVSGSQQEKSAAATSDAECADEPIEIMSFAGAKDAITQVQSGRVAAFMAPRMILEGVVETSSGAFAVTDADYADFPFAMGVTLDNADFAEALAGALEELVQNGRYGEILADWDVEDLALSGDQIGVNTGSTAAFDVNN